MINRRIDVEIKEIPFSDKLIGLGIGIVICAILAVVVMYLSKINDKLTLTA